MGEAQVTTPQRIRPYSRLRRTPNSAEQNGVSTKADTP
jgi:hypothetical protein